jgi:hypothetical protein
VRDERRQAPQRRLLVGDPLAFACRLEHYLHGEHHSIPQTPQRRSWQAGGDEQ